MPPRKRFSAFDDLTPEESQPEQPSKVQPSAVPAAEPQVERIERLTPSQMLPDRFQPRRLLPAAIRAAFFAGKLDCYAAARAWLKLAETDAGAKAEVDRLLSMGHSFDAYGQIKPITGSWVVASDGGYIFQIETGERRFWAACLQAVTHNASGEPLLRVEVVPQPTRQRQVVENRHAEPPSAVEQACEVASLILAELGIDPDPRSADEFDYFRQARNQRMPAGLWERVQPIMQLTRPRMVQLLNILQLPTPLLELADRYRLPERVLREVLALPSDGWERMLRVSIQHQLTSEEIGEAAERELPAERERRDRNPSLPLDPAQRAFLSLRRFARILDELDPQTRADVIDDLADRMVVTGLDEDLTETLDELMTLIQARQRRR
jgi:hypothetical protein